MRRPQSVILVAVAIAIGAAWPTAAHAQPADPTPQGADSMRRSFYVRAGAALIKPLSSSREREFAVRE